MSNNTQNPKKFKAPVRVADLPKAVQFAFDTPTRMMHLTGIDPAMRRPIVGKSFAKTDSGKAAALRWLSDATTKGYGVYFNINEVTPPLGPRHPKAKETDISTVYALHVDVDPPEGTTPDMLDAARATMLAKIETASPSLIVDSGNGYGVFFSLDATAVSEGNLADIKARNKALATQLGGDSCYDLCRVMRLPGTINLPNAKKIKAGRVPVLASVVSDDRDLICYALGDFKPAAVSNDNSEKPSTTDTGGTAYEKIGSPDIPDAVDLSKLDAALRDLIVVGAAAGDDRSKAVYMVACDLRREGWSDGDILAVLTNASYGIADHIFDQPQRDPIDQASRVIADMDRRGIARGKTAEDEFGDLEEEVAGKSTPAIDLEKIKRRIRKLLRKTTAAGCTQEEAASSLAKARELMAANGIDEDDDLKKAKKAKTPPPPTTAKLDDFIAFLPENKYFFIPTRALWPRSTIDSILGPEAAAELDRTRHSAILAWCPGEEQWIKDRILVKGGWINKKGSHTINTYIAPPPMTPGDASKATPWVEHFYRLYPTDAKHIINVLAHKVRFPGVKVNHCVIMGSDQQGIGKDTLLEPIVRILGEWNVADVTATQSMDPKFNPHLESLMCRISEANDLGDDDRYSFYNRRKTWCVAPPSAITVADKHVKAHPVLNVTLPFFSSNDKAGIYIDRLDRRHYAAWSDSKQAEFTPEFFTEMYRWYDDGGIEHILAYLQAVDLSAFDPKAPPPKTAAWLEIVNADQSTETSQLDDLIDDFNAPWSDERPAVFTIKQLISSAMGHDGNGRFDDALELLTDKRQAKLLARKLGRAGYQSVQADAETAKDGLWRVAGERVVIYGRTDLPMRDRLTAARKLTKELFVSNAEQQSKERAARRAKRPGTAAA